MKEEFKVYLDSMGLTSKTVKANIELYIRYARKLCKEDITEIFVEDFYTDNGSREYGSLWLVSTGYVCEARDFRSTVEYDIDIAPIKDGVSYLRTYLKNYDLEGTSNESRVKIMCVNKQSTSFEMKATSENCNKLMELIENYIKPNM